MLVSSGIFQGNSKYLHEIWNADTPFLLIGRYKFIYLINQMDMQQVVFFFFFAIYIFLLEMWKRLNDAQIIRPSNLSHNSVSITLYDLDITYKPEPKKYSLMRHSLYVLLRINRSCNYTLMLISLLNYPKYDIASLSTPAYPQDMNDIQILHLEVVIERGHETIAYPQCIAFQDNFSCWVPDVFI